jgi:hypothetical protein
MATLVLWTVPPQATQRDSAASDVVEPNPKTAILVERLVDRYPHCVHRIEITRTWP